MSKPIDQQLSIVKSKSAPAGFNDFDNATAIIERRNANLKNLEDDKTNQSQQLDSSTDHTLILSQSDDKSSCLSSSFNSSTLNSSFWNEESSSATLYATQESQSSSDETLVDYQTDNEHKHHAKKMKKDYECRCGAKKCRGTMLALEEK